jgi:hypothetical protein
MRKEYYQNNPGAWDEIRSVFREYRKHQPFSAHQDLEVAQIAVWTQHWDEANQLFKEVGEAYDTWVMSIDEMHRMRAEASSRAGSGHGEKF